MVNLIILTYLFLFSGAGSVFANSVVLNELMPHPSPGSDWVEIYNTTASSIDFTNWTLVDSTSNMKTLSGSISANGFISFDVSNRLNNPGDSIYLKDSSGATIDSYSYSSDPGINISFGRSPDGGNWSTLVSSSKGGTNGEISSPTPSPLPTPTPAPTNSPNSQDPSSTNSSSFTISDIPSQINSDQSFNVSVNLSLPNPGATYYLSGAFKVVDGTRYFGLTKINSDWISYSSENFLNQYKITTDGSGAWNGSLEVKPDAADSDYKGTGDYIFRVARYTQAGSQTWSNDGTIKIIGTTQGSDSSETPSNDSPSPSSTTSPPVKNIVTASQNKSSAKTEYKIASIAGVTTTASPSATFSIEIKSQKQINFPLIIGLVLVTSGIGLSSYIYLRSHETIFNKFRNRN